MAIIVREYVDAAGVAPFAKWFNRIEANAAARVTIALIRMQQGNLSEVQGVGAGVYEYRIHYGPGYRVYFGKDGDQLIILLGGGTKKRQHKDVANAHAVWLDYKRRKKLEI